MKLAITLLLMSALCRAAEEPISQKKTEDESKTEKRALVEGNAAIQKRAPIAIIPTALPSPTPGIEYVNVKDVQAEKSPAQQIYATPVPLAKISDVLTGQGPPFHTAIASHLYAPISIYQARLSSPTTYEVSAPVPSQLAYSEKISYQPVQYTPQVELNKVQTPKQTTFRLLPQQEIPQPNVVYQPQIPHLLQAQYQKPQYQIPYSPVQLQQQVAYIQQPLYQHPVGIVYSQSENQKLVQSPLNSPEPAKVIETSTPVPTKAPEQNYNSQSQGAVSYASFSQGPPAQPQAPAPQQNKQPVYQQQPQHQPQQPQYQPQKPQYQPQLQIQPQQLQYQQQNQQQLQRPQQQYEIQRQPIYHLNLPQVQQYQPQYQIAYQQPQYQIRQPEYQIQQPQFIQQLQAVQQPQVFKYQGAPGNTIQAQSKAVERPVFIRSQPAQVYQGVASYQPQGLSAGSFPAVQYFGKFAQSLFGGYQNQ